MNLVVKFPFWKLGSSISFWWKGIVDLIPSTIYSLKEYANSSNIYDDYGDPKKIKRRQNSQDVEK